MDTTATELARRRNASIDVALFWTRATGQVTVTVADIASGLVLTLPVPPEQALDAFHHPHAYVELDRPRGRTGVTYYHAND